LFCTLLPVVALLLLAVLGTQRIPDMESAPFIWTFFIASLVTFTGELLMVLLIQRVSVLRLLALVRVCRQASSDTSVRVPAQGNDEFGSLAAAINALILSRDPSRSPIFPQEEPSSSSTEAHQGALPQKMEEMLQSITPAIDGDLRARAPVSADVLGVVADTVNYLIEELGRFVRQVRNTSAQMVATTDDLLERETTMARSAEAQMLCLAQTTEAIESLVAFLQRVTRVVQISVETAHQVRDSLMQSSDALNYAARMVLSREALAQPLADLWNARASLDEAIQVLQASPSSRGEKKLKSRPTRAGAGETKQSQNQTEEAERRARLVQALLAMRSALEYVGPSAFESASKLPALGTFRDASVLVQGPLERLTPHIDLLKDTMPQAETMTKAAEACVSHLYLLGEQMKESSLSLLAQAERISSLAVVARSARSATALYVLSNEREEEESATRSGEAPS
jgi:HAMP domain-containing protein